MTGRPDRQPEPLLNAQAIGSRFSPLRQIRSQMRHWTRIAKSGKLVPKLRVAESVYRQNNAASEVRPANNGHTAWEGLEWLLLLSRLRQAMVWSNPPGDPC